MHRILLAISLLFVCAACESRACVPGESRACVGAAGCSGGQRCNDEGSGYEACLCAGDEVCGADVCLGTEDCCGGMCVDTETASSHCGMCGNACPGGASCFGGSCRIVLLDSGI